MTLENIEELVEGFDRYHGEKNKANLIAAIFAITNVISLIYFGPDSGAYNILFSIFMVTFIAWIVMIIRFRMWFKKRTMDEVVLLHFRKNFKMDANKLHAIWQEKIEFDKKVESWYDNLEAEDQKMADVYARKFFNEIVGNIESGKANGDIKMYKDE